MSSLVSLLHLVPMQILGKCELRDVIATLLPPFEPTHQSGMVVLPIYFNSGSELT